VLAVTISPRGLTVALSGEAYLVPEAPHGGIALAARPGRVRGQNPRSDPLLHLLRARMSSDRRMHDIVSHSKVGQNRNFEQS